MWPLNKTNLQMRLIVPVQTNPSAFYKPAIMLYGKISYFVPYMTTYRQKNRLPDIHVKSCILSFGWYQSGVWILCADVSEHPVWSVPKRRHIKFRGQERVKHLEHGGSSKSRTYDKVCQERSRSIRTWPETMAVNVPNTLSNAGWTEWKVKSYSIKSQKRISRYIRFYDNTYYTRTT